MPISWNEIRHNAIQFSREWAAETREEAEAKSFWDEFFQVFGIRRRTVASFEEPVKKISGDYGYIDLFWRGVLLVEHKSFGKNLGRAESQAFRYIQDLQRDGRGSEVPRYLIISDFARIALHDLDSPGKPITVEFGLADLHRHIHDFAFIPGYQTHTFAEQDPINLQATAIMGDLHDAIEGGGYNEHDLERFLVRILFCLFAEDTGIFERESFRLYLENKTAPDGSDLGMRLNRLFSLLDTPEENRQSNLDEDLVGFRYVNGALFAERLDFADLNRDMRNALLACTRFDWSRISPAIFGSLFQSVMQPKERRQIGAHYTSERDILKVARALFLDDLRAEFQRIQHSKADLRRFHQRIAKLRFLDPACGCGNFLVITYRELRLLELDILRALHGTTGQIQQELDAASLSLVDVDAFYGIEVSEWPARIAEVAMWLMDHQMNLLLSETFGQYFVRLPLKKSPVIVHGNALRLDWKTILPPEQCSFILGNPPFLGHHYQSAEQKADQDLIMVAIQGHGTLDYVANWYVKAAEYITGTRIPVAFVSTNSITQGEQVGLLWNHLFQRYHLKIHFAHRTFEWQSEARGKAHVHVVIIGFAAYDIPIKRIYHYENEDVMWSKDPHTSRLREPAALPEKKISITVVSNISPYLLEGSDTVVLPRTHPICDVPKMSWGNKPTDGGHFILSPEERAELLAAEPAAAPFIRRYMSGGDFLNGIERYCLWLVDIEPHLLSKMPCVLQRVKAVRESRLASRAASTRAYANQPAIFRQIAQPASAYLAVPEVSSERRHYIPMAYLPAEVICSNKIQFVPNASHYHFGVLTSAMHMAWMRMVGGRLKSDYSYSNSLVYNSFPWPAALTEKQRLAIESAAQNVLHARAKFPDSTFADLYDPNSMPTALLIAHTALDRAVDAAYRPQSFLSERARVEHLFALYEKLTVPLLPRAKVPRRKEKT